MKYLSTSLIVPAFAILAGCSTGPRHVSCTEFERAYALGNNQTLQSYTYLGETNGAVYMHHYRVPLFGSKPSQRILYTETNGLTPGFLEKMTKETSSITNHIK